MDDQVCLGEYDRSSVEIPLLELVTRLQTNYQLQDVSNAWR